MLKIARVCWKTPADYHNTSVKIDINEEDFPNLVYQAARMNPKRLDIIGIEEIPENYLQILGLQNREFDISLNGFIIPSMNIPTAQFKFVDINYNNIPPLLAKIYVDENQTVYSILKKYQGKLIPPNEYKLLLEGLTVYTNRANAKVRELNQIKDWRKIEDFYVLATYAGHTSKPTFKVYSPSAKTYLEEKFYSEYQEDIEDLTQPLIEPIETIQMEMRTYDLNVPDIRVIRDSKQAWKTKYTRIEYGDMDVNNYVPYKAPKEEAPKFQGFTRPLETIVYWPDKDTLLKKYYNDTKERNIPNEIREELVTTPVQPNWWYNINHLYTQWIEAQPEEIKKEFYPLDSEICPVCLNRYNIYQGCIDQVTEEYHVEPIMELPDNIADTSNDYYDQFGDDCFCKRVEAYLEILNNNK
jgi:hypothetical protein